jgi:hypothetical protein
VAVAVAAVAYASTFSGQCKNAHYLTFWYARLAAVAAAIASTFHGRVN